MLWKSMIDIGFLNILEIPLKTPNTHSIHIHVFKCLKLYDWNIGDKYCYDLGTSIFGLYVYYASSIMISWTFTLYIFLIASFNFTPFARNGLMIRAEKKHKYCDRTWEPSKNIYESSFRIHNWLNNHTIIVMSIKPIHYVGITRFIKENVSAIIHRVIHKQTHYNLKINVYLYD